MRALALLCALVAGAALAQSPVPGAPAARAIAHVGVPGSSSSFTTSGQGCTLGDATGPLATESCSLQVQNTQCFEIGTEGTLCGSAGGGGTWTLTTPGGGLVLVASPLTLSNAQGLYFNTSQTDGILQVGGIHTWTSNVASGSASSGVVNVNTSNTLATAGDTLFALANNSAREFAVDYAGNATSIGWGRSATPGHRGFFQTVASGDTTLTAVGLPAMGTTCTGTCTPVNDVSDTNYVSMVKFPTVGTTGDSCGDCNGPFTMTRATALPLGTFIVRTDAAAVTTVRYYVGMASAGLDQVVSTAGANAIKGCYFRFDSALDTSTWKAESSDGTTASITDTTVTVSAATTYVMAIDNSVSGTCGFYINGTKWVSKSSNINADSTLLDVHFTVTTLANSVRNLSVAVAGAQQR